MCARASKPTTSSPSQPQRGFKILPTGSNSDSEEEEDNPDSNARATYARATATFARILPPSQKKTSQLEVEPRPVRVRAGRIVTRNHP